jgi:hypothetical protein
LEGSDNKISGKEIMERGSKQFDVPTGPRKKGAREEMREQEYR